MFEVMSIQMGKNNVLYSYMDEITAKYKNMYNVANFYIRQIMFGVDLKPEERTKEQNEIFNIVKENIKILNKVKIDTLNKTLTKINSDSSLSKIEKSKLFKQAAKKALPYKEPSKDKWFLNYYELEGILRHSNNIDYKALPAQVAQQAIKDCIHDWNAYFKTLKDYNKNPSKYSGKPKIPKYKKGIRTTATFTNARTVIKYINNQYYLKFTGCDELLRLGNNVANKRLTEVKVIPFYNKYKIILTFGEKQTKTIDKKVFESKRIMGIDLGLVNFVSISNNIGINPIIIKGNFIKAENQYFNKQKAYYTSCLKEYQDTKNLSRLSRNRSNRIKDYFYKIGHYIINLAKINNIDTIIIGKNNSWKQSINIGKINNQNFVNIPYNQFLKILENLCVKNNIHIILREESYTSKASFLDMDTIPTYKENEDYKFSGKRTKRGLYKTKENILINADINGASNIIRKEFPNAFNNLKLEYLYKTTKVVRYKDLYKWRGLHPDAAIGVAFFK